MKKDAGIPVLIACSRTVWVCVPSIAAALLGRSGTFAASRTLPGQTAHR